MRETLNSDRESVFSLLDWNLDKGEGACLVRHNLLANVDIESGSGSIGIGDRGLGIDAED